MHICNSCTRYVVVTYCSIISTSCKKRVSYTCNSGELIQVGTEQLPNKRIFIYFPYCIFILILGAIFITNLTNYYIDPFFQLTCAVFWIYNDSVNKFSITIIAIITERDFKSEYLFRMCSVETNMVTSLEFQPLLCATMLCHFGQTRNGYVATRFILLSSTAESSATSGYVVDPERSGQSEVRASRNVEWTRRKPSFVPNSGFNRCSK